MPPLRAAIVLLLAACSAETAPNGDPPDAAVGLTDAVTPLPALPGPVDSRSDRFTSSGPCGACHQAGSGAALRDPAGRDVSPVGLWRASLMALAARDPFYLAAFADERSGRTAAGARVVDATCAPCHAPAGALDEIDAGRTLGFEALTAGGGASAALGRDGVTCSLCHQIGPDGLGTAASYSGGFRVGRRRLIFGPHAAPLTTPMETLVSYTPTLGDHIGSSALCGTCHTVLTRALDADGRPVGPVVAEQATYLEWRGSTYAGTTECQGCHVPVTDEDGLPLRTAIATNPTTLTPRAPVGRHSFVGGNAFMLRLLADAADWAGHGVPPAELVAQAERNEAHLATAASVEILDAGREGDRLVVRVAVHNHTGHKLPTGYPGRRVWVELVAEAGGAPFFVSGAVDELGHLVAEGRRLDESPLPHRDEIVSRDQVAVYEAVLRDAGGQATRRTLAAVGYLKDDRILPEGWTPAAPDAATTAPIGTAGDPDYAAGGTDRVVYRIPAPAGAVRIRVRLMFQSVPPGVLAGFSPARTPAAARLLSMTTGERAPIEIARATRDLP